MLPYWMYTGKFSEARIPRLCGTRIHQAVYYASFQKLKGQKGGQSARLTSGNMNFQCRSEISDCIRQASGTGRRMTTV